MSNKISHYVIRIGFGRDPEEGINFYGPSESEVIVFDADDNAEKTKELDAIFTYNLSGESSDEYMVAHDTFLNQDLIIGEQKKEKIGYWFYSNTLDKNNLNFRNRSFVPFETLKLQNDGRKMNSDFRLTYALPHRLDFYNNPVVFLFGYIPGPNDLGGKLAIYIVDHTYDSATLKYKDFKIIRKGEDTVLDESFGSLKFMTCNAYYSTHIKKFIVQVQTYKKFQTFVFDEYISPANIKKYTKLTFSTEFATATPAYQYPTSIIGKKFIISGLMSRGDSKKLNSAVITSKISLATDQSKESLPPMFLPFEKNVIGFEGTTYKYYVPQHENMLVIDSAKHPGNKITVPIKASIKGSPSINETLSVVFNKMSGWNEKADLGNFSFNQINSYGTGWVNIPIGGESLEGNGATVEVDIDGVDKANIQNIIADLSKLKLTFLTNKEI